jgi:hypothetical protein
MVFMMIIIIDGDDDDQLQQATNPRVEDIDREN